MMDLGEFKADVYNHAKNMVKEYPCLRLGQAVYDYVVSTYKIPIDVNEINSVDCYQNNCYIEPFINASYNEYVKLQLKMYKM